jgi:apolipoprotein N-acyltransferase
MHTAVKPHNLSLSNGLLAVLSGCLLTGAFPKIGFSWLAWVGLTPLFFAIAQQSLSNAFRLGIVAGLSHYLTLMYWLVKTMQTYGQLPWYLGVGALFLLCFYLSLYVGIFAVGVRWYNWQGKVSLLYISGLWVGLEYVRSFFLTGFPWELLGYSQYRQIEIIQIADITGVYGISFLIVAANCMIYKVISTFRMLPHAFKDKAMWGSLAFLSAMLVSCGFYGIWRIQTIDKEIAGATQRNIAIIQGNIPQDQKWDPAFQVASTQKYIHLSTDTQEGEPELVIWPETATPFYFVHHAPLTQLVLNGIRATGAAFLIGSPSLSISPEGTSYFNSAFLIDGDGQIIDKYDKSHLVPYGEYVPLKKWMPFLGKMVSQVGDFQRGDAGATLAWKNERLGVQICYEIIFPELSRASVQNGATLLVNLTNDAWYGKSSAPYQHFSMVVFRAIENRRALIRAANTGISGCIDPVGRVLSATTLFKEATPTCQVPILKNSTLYSRLGDTFAIGSLLMTLGLSLWYYQIDKKRKNVNIRR